MVTKKAGQYKVKLPTQYKSKNKKVLKKEGNKLNYTIKKCIICNKNKMEKYELLESKTIEDDKGIPIKINRCKSCGYINISYLCINSEIMSNTVVPIRALINQQEEQEEDKK